MYWKLPDATNQWHDFTFNVQELYDATHKKGGFAGLGATKMQVAVGVWNQNNLAGHSSEARFAALTLSQAGGASKVDGQLLPVDDSVFTCSFGQSKDDKV